MWGEIFEENENSKGFTFLIEIWNFLVRFYFCNDFCILDIEGIILKVIVFMWY